MISTTVTDLGIDPNFNRMPILGCILPFGWGAFLCFGVQMGCIEIRLGCVLDEIEARRKILCKRFSTKSRISRYQCA